jgi:hypothetical protein
MQLISLLADAIAQPHGAQFFALGLLIGACRLAKKPR